MIFHSLPKGPSLTPPSLALARHVLTLLLLLLLRHHLLFLCSSLARDGIHQTVKQEAAKGYMKEKAAELRPKLQEAYQQAEPSLQEFMRSPQVEYLKKNPKAMAAMLAIFVAVGVPGAATLMTCVNLMGPMETLFPILMTLVVPASELLV